MVGVDEYNMGLYFPIIHWPFQEPKLEVPTIYNKVYVRAMHGDIPQNMAFIWYSTSSLGT